MPTVPLYVYDKLIKRLAKKYKQDLTVDDLKGEIINFRIAKRDVFYLINDLTRLGLVQKKSKKVIRINGYK